MVSVIKNLSIKAQLTILCLIILIPLLAFQGLEIRSKYRTLYEREVQANLEIARAVRRLFLGYVNTVLRAETGIIIAIAEKGHTPEEISRILTEYERQTKLAINFGWLSPECRVIASSNPSAIGMDLSDRPHLLQVAQGADWSISDLFVGRVAQVPVFHICKAVRDASGNLKGILVASVDEGRLESALSFERGNSAGIALIDRNGMLVFRYPRIETSWEDRNWLKFYPFIREVLAGKEYVGTYTANYDGKPRIIANLPMPFGWIAGAGRSEDEIVGNVLSQIQTSLVVFGLILAAALIAVTVVARQITRGVLALKEKSDAVGRGEYIAKEHLAGTKEFQDLSNALNTMSEKVRAREEALRESEQRFRLAQQAARVGTFEWNIQTGLSIWTPEVEAMYGLQPGEFEKTQRAWEQLVHPDDRDEALRLAKRSFESGEPVVGEWRTAWRDGSVHWIAARWQVLKDEGGKPLRMIGVNMDITERKKAEEELRHLNENLEQLVQERTEKLRRLASELTLVEQRERKKLSTILHDGLQQYLVAAKMQLNGLMPEVAEERLRQSISDIEQLLGDAVLVSRSLAAELSPPILRDAGILAGLEWLSRWMLEKHQLKVQLVMEMDAPSLEEDVKILLFESVREILLNTVKHSNSRSAKIHLFQSQGDQLGLTVGDDGKGFVPQASNNAGSKEGFGLFSIQERLSVIGGTFELASAPGKGCRITLTAPLGQSKLLDSSQTASAETQPLPSPASAGVLLGKVRILIVDDHIVMREGLARLLAQEPDFDVIGQAADGQQAIEKAALLQPALILMDISMPVLDGIEATKIIRQQHPHIHIIGLSLYTEDERAREMLSAGASFYMSKSGPPSELKAAIRSCCWEIGPFADPSKSLAGKLVQ